MELSSTAIVLLTVTSFILWSALYGHLCITLPHRSYEWNYRVVVTVHAVAVLIATAACEFVIDSWRFTFPGKPSNSYEIITMTACLGYFIYDLIYSFYSGEPNKMLVHHSLSLTVLVASLTSGLSGAEILLCLFLGELTNPLLQVRFFMRYAGMTDRILYDVNNFTFLVTFPVIRLGIGSYLLYCYVTNPLPLMIFKISGMAHHAVSVVFMADILSVAFRTYITKTFV